MPIAPRGACQLPSGWLSTTAETMRPLPPCRFSLEAYAVNRTISLLEPAGFSPAAPVIEPPFERSIVSQRNEWACSSRARLKSATITTAAPSRNTANAAASPTGPAPEMSTVEPVVTPALTHPL